MLTLNNIYIYIPINSIYKYTILFILLIKNKNVLINLGNKLCEVTQISKFTFRNYYEMCVYISFL